VHLLYEEDGELKAGTVLERSPASFRVESPHGRRSKVKAGNVLLSFDEPPPAQLLGAAERFARELATGVITGVLIGAAFFPFAFAVWGEADVAAELDLRAIALDRGDGAVLV